MKIVESNMTRKEYRRLIKEASHCYGELGIDDITLNEQADALLDLAMQFPAGAVVERDGENFQQRQISN